MTSIKKAIAYTLCTISFFFINNQTLRAQNSAETTGQGCAHVEIFEMINDDTVSFTASDRNLGLFLSCDRWKRVLYPYGFAPGYPDPDKGYYTYEKINYDPPSEFNKGSKITLPEDDCWSEMFSFDYYFPPKEDSDTPGFSFYFYDESYNIVMANSNGGLHMFNTSSPLLTYAIANNKNLYQKPTSGNYLYCPYATSQAFPDNRTQWGSSASPVLNSINGPFCDIHYGLANGNQGMYINFIGEYPCRMCILSFYDIPMYGNDNKDTAHITSMIVLYETTNVIEFYMKRKPAFTSTNGSNAILGIQNVDGTKSTTITNNNYTAKGASKTQSYNNTVWEATNEAWRISPTGELTKSFAWYKKNTEGNLKDSLQLLVESNDPQTIDANPELDEGDTWYYAKMIVTRMEDGLEFEVWDSILVHPLDVPALTISHNSADNPETVKMNSDSLSRYDTICAGDRVTFRFKGGDEYHFVAPASLAAQQILNGTATIYQNPDVEKVFYKFQVINFKNGNKNDTVCKRYDSVYIVNRKVAVNIGNDTAVCQGQSVLYFDTLKENIGDYLWTFNSVVSTVDSALFVPENSGTLTLKLTDNRACSATDEAQINVIKYPVITIEGDKDICNGSSTTLTAKHDADGVLYQWSNGGNGASITVQPQVTTDYEVNVTTDTALCTSTKSTTVNVYPIPQIQTLEDAKICAEETALIGVTGEAERYEWSSKDASVNQGTLTEYTVSPETTTQYTVTAYNNPTLNCQSSATMTVFVEQKPNPVIAMSPEFIDELTPVVVFTDNTVGTVDRLWEISDGATSTDKNFRHTFELEDSIATYYVTLIGYTDFGCTDSVTNEISVIRDHHIWAPTGIYIHSTNPSNSRFQLNVDAVEDFNLKIFDRWGTVVFETNDVTQSWDCTYKGKPVQQGVYTWYASYHHSDSPDRLMQKAGTFMIYN